MKRYIICKTIIEAQRYAKQPYVGMPLLIAKQLLPGYLSHSIYEIETNTTTTVRRIGARKAKGKK